MKFTHLREIVKNVQDKLVCPNCQQHFAEHAIDVVDVVGSKGVFAAQCTCCNTSVLVTMSVREFKQKIAAREKQVGKVATTKVSPSDVIEMKSVLDGFDGDFATIFAEPKLPELQEQKSTEQTPPPGPMQA
jgi:hypothetical protein